MYREQLHLQSKSIFKARVLSYKASLACKGKNTALYRLAAWESLNDASKCGVGNACFGQTGLSLSEDKAKQTERLNFPIDEG